MIGLTSQIRRKRDANKQWSSYINYGWEEDGIDIPGWENVKPANLGTGGTFNNILDTNGVPRLNLIFPNSSVADAPQAIQDMYLGNPEHPDLYKYLFVNTGNGELHITGLDDDKFYQIIVVGNSFDPVVLETAALPVIVNGEPVDIPQWPDYDPTFEYSRSFVNIWNIQSDGGVIHLEYVSTVEHPATVYFGLIVNEYREPVSQNSSYEITAIPTDDVLEPPVPYYTAIRAGTENDELPLIISLPPGGTEGDGSSGQLGIIKSSTLYSAVEKGTFNPPEDVRVVACQFYENTNNADLLEDLIGHLISTYNIDESRIYLVGISAGMSVGLSYIGGGYQYPIAAAALSCSMYTPDEIGWEGYPSFEDIASTEVPLWLWGVEGDGAMPAMVEDVKDELLDVDEEYPVKFSVLNSISALSAVNHGAPAIYQYGRRDDFPGMVPGHDEYRNGEIWRWLLEYSIEPSPEPIGEELVSLTVNVVGLTEGYNILMNDEVQPNNTMLLPINTNIDGVTVSAEGYTFTPESINVLMDDDKTITFTAIPD